MMPLLGPVEAVPCGWPPGQYGVQVDAELTEDGLAARGEPVAQVPSRRGQPVVHRLVGMMPPVTPG